MTMRFLFVAMLAGLHGVMAMAQSCPREKAEDVPASITYGAIQNCGGFSYQIPGVSITVTPKGCPLFIIYTPPHQRAVRSDAETKVDSLGVSPITMATFSCSQAWFVFIPIGSTCEHDQTTTVGSVLLLKTNGC